MSDLISRQDAIEAIAKRIYHIEDGNENDALRKAICDIDALPSVNAIPYDSTVTLNSPTIIKATSTDLISRQDAIEGIREYINEYKYNDIKWSAMKEAEMLIESLPPADRLTDEEDQLKFYYVESIDDYWIGKRLDNFYYADWHKGLGFVWSKSRYLPWGEHIVDENTLWKEHTYPSEPIEIPFTEWIFGFVKKYFADRPTGRWLSGDCKGAHCSVCDEYTPFTTAGRSYPYCPNCGAKMGG